MNYYNINLHTYLINKNAFYFLFDRCKCYKWKTKKRHRYSLLQEVDDAKDEIKLLPKGTLI